MSQETPPAVEAIDLTRRFGDVLALDHVSLRIRPGEFFSLLGPSGCGKTTLLRLIAGLDVADAGELRIGGQDARLTPAHRRPVNTVFQSYALFPHLDVRDNVAFGLRMKNVPRAEIERRVAAVLATVEITALAARRPSQLSGGQKQRVALARAIVNEPQVLLLDEPLAALDLKLRKQLQLELRNLQRRLGITFVYVTHDQEEALVLSDRLAVLRDGRIEQLGDARTLYDQPRTRFVSQFLGSCSLIEARPGHTPNEIGFPAETALGNFRVEAPHPRRERVTLAIRPERVRLLPLANPPGANQVRVRIAECLYVGSETHYVLEAGPLQLRAEVMNAGSGGPPLRAGDDVLAELPSTSLVVLDD